MSVAVFLAAANEVRLMTVPQKALESATNSGGRFVWNYKQAHRPAFVNSVELFL